MDDFNILWYVLAAIIYFITRSKKKPKPTARPGTENNPEPQGPPKTFEDLLKEITGEAVLDPEEEVLEPIKETVKEPEPVNQEEEAAEQRRLEGERRAFADEESRKIYEESIKRAEGFNLEFEKDEHYKQPRVLKGDIEEEEEYTFADEIRDGLSSSEARKAIIYSEILNRRY